MNIFFLDTDVEKCARAHCDKHMKMCLEAGQLLSTCYRIKMGSEEKRLSKSGKRLVKHWKLQGELEEILYLPTHYNHPCRLWLNETYEGYMWTLELMKCLSVENKLRFGKYHSTSTKLYDILSKIPSDVFENQHFVKPALAMPEDYKEDDPVQAYRNYYNGEKLRLATYTNVEKPYWLKNL